jgi:hypothetical protein
MNKSLKYMLTNKLFVLDLWNTNHQYTDLKNKINERFYFNLIKFSGIEYTENELLIVIDDICKPMLENISSKIYDSLNDVDSIRNIKLDCKFEAESSNIVDFIIKYVKENTIPSVDLIQNILAEYILASNLMQKEIKSLCKRLKSSQPIHDFELIELIFEALKNAGVDCVTQAKKDSGIISDLLFNRYCFFCWVESFHHHVHSFIHYLFSF